MTNNTLTVQRCQDKCSRLRTDSTTIYSALIETCSICTSIKLACLLTFINFLGSCVQTANKFLSAKYLKKSKWVPLNSYAACLTGRSWRCTSYKKNVTALCRNEKNTFVSIITHTLCLWYHHSLWYVSWIISISKYLKPKI